MHVRIKVIISLISKFDLLQVHFDSDVRNVNILEIYWFLKLVGRFVRDVPEGVQEFFGPIFEQGYMGGQVFAQISQQFLKRRSLLDLKEVLVEISVSQIVKSEIAGQVLGQQKFFCGSDLVEKLG